MSLRDQWTHERKVIVAGVLAGFLGMGLFAGVGKIWYYVKVVRTVERILKEQTKGAIVFTW